MSDQQDTAVAEPEGYLRRMLQRSNKQIREERGEIIHEDLELVYKREIEDLARKIRHAQRERQNAFDFSPDSTQSLVLKDDFDAYSVMRTDLETGLKLRNMRVQLQDAIIQYNYLFGETYKQIAVESNDPIELETLKLN